MAKLEELPPELLGRILRDVGSPLDLFHLISASPRCLAVFSLSPEVILATVLKRAIPPDARRHLLAVLSIPTDPATTTAQRDSFLDRYLTSTESSDFPESMSDLAALSRLYNHISYFEDSYFDSAASQLGPAGSPKPLRPSLSERTRLQRAFARFELYCRAFPLPRGPSGPFHLPRDQFDLFLGELSIWEVEEISCVYHYLSSLVGSYVDNLGDQFVEAARSAPGATKPPVVGFASQTHIVAILGHKNKPVDLTYLATLSPSTMKMFLFSNLSAQSGLFGTMISHGLAFNHRLACAQSAGDTRMLRANYSALAREFIPKALSVAVFPNQQLTVQPANVDDDDPSHANLAYYLFKNTKYERYLNFSALKHCRPALRELGFVFWDSQRIMTPTAIAQLNAAKNIDYWESAKRFERTHRRSPEQRLRGVKLPRAEYDRLEREFGTIR